MNSYYSNFLLHKIIKKIDQSPEKKITFSQYMDLCLYDSEYGYYNLNNIKIGIEGDFFTSTSLSTDFGELLAVQLQEFWQVLGKPKPFTLVEIGSGEGILALNILNFLYTHNSDFFESLEYIIIEKSSTLKAKQKELLTKQLVKEIRVTWYDLDSLIDESIIGCFFSNELIDAMPVHLVRWHNNHLQEIYLTNNGEELKELCGDLSTNKINDYFQLINVEFSSTYPENYQTEVNLQALDYLTKISRKLKQGYILTIDYGYTSDKYYHPQRFQGTLKCYYQHRHHSNAYVNIGIQDITSHVNFTALQNHGELLGLFNIAYTQQALFLMSLGLGNRINELSNGKTSYPEILRRRNQLHNLINPQGLGNFKILLQSKNISNKQNNFSLQGFNHEIK